MTESDWWVLRRVLKMNWKQIREALGISERQFRRYLREEAQVPDKVKVGIDGLICRELHQKDPEQMERARRTLSMRGGG